MSENSKDIPNLMEPSSETDVSVEYSKDNGSTSTTNHSIHLNKVDNIVEKISVDNEKEVNAPPQKEEESPVQITHLNLRTKMSTSLNDFEVISVIGTGTYGTCKKIRRKKDGKIMVWKEMDYGSMTETEKQMLVSEVNLLRELRHQHIVKYYDRIIDRSRAVIYIIMEYCQGGDLASIICRNRKEGTHVDEEFAWKILIQMNLALKECHRRKNGKAVLHRDLKPANVFLDANSNVKLGDFGLARVLHHESSFANTYVGTPYYMSPELVNNLSYNEKSDIWSLGCMLYELCALAPPFTAPNQPELNRKIRIGDFPRLPMKYSTELDFIIRRMIQIEVAKRPSIDAILADPSVKRRRETLDRSGSSSSIQKSSKSAIKADKVYCEVKENALNMKMKQLELKEKELESRERSLALREKLADDKMKRAIEMTHRYSDSDSSPGSRSAAVSPFLQSPSSQFLQSPSQDDESHFSPQQSCLSKGSKYPESHKKHVTFDQYLNGKENLRHKPGYSRLHREYDAYTSPYRREESLTSKSYDFDIFRGETAESRIAMKYKDRFDSPRLATDYSYRSELSKLNSKNILFFR